MFVYPLEDIHEDYNFLMGYHTGKKREWYCGIENIYSIFMGAWSDSLVGYKGYAINENYITDTFWQRYQEEYPGPDYKNREAYRKYEDEYDNYLYDNRHEVYELLDNIIENYKAEQKEVA